MTMVNLETEITYLPGVGPKRAKVLGEELGRLMVVVR